MSLDEGINEGIVELHTQELERDVDQVLKEVQPDRHLDAIVITMAKALRKQINLPHPEEAFERILGTVLTILERETAMPMGYERALRTAFVTEIAQLAFDAEHSLSVNESRRQAALEHIQAGVQSGALHIADPSAFEQVFGPPLREADRLDG